MTNPIPAPLLPALAARFRALADPVRLELLDQLADGERCVGDLVRATGRSQPNVSRQLACLARAGLVAPRRDGNRTWYRIVDPLLPDLCNAACAALEQDLDRRSHGHRPSADPSLSR